MSQFYARVTRATLRYPHATLAFAVLLTGVSLAYTVTTLGYRTSRLDLLNPDSDYNRHWIEYIKEFGDEDDAVVVVEGPNRDEVVPVLEEISRQLAREERLFHAVLHEVDLRKIRGKGLHYLPSDELLKLEKFLGEAAQIVDGDWSQLNLGKLCQSMSQQFEAAARAAMAARGAPGAPAMPPPELTNSPLAMPVPGMPGGNADAAQGAGLLERLAEGLRGALAGRAEYRSPWPEMPEAFATLSELSSEYLLTKEGKLGFVLLRLAPGNNAFARGSEAVDACRKLIAQVRLKHPHVNIGLTGLPVLENDEMRASEQSMTWASGLSIAGVVVLFIAGFGGLRHALLANLVLIAGSIWAFGFATLSVGHLNILSVSFTVMLVGLGIDYGVNYVARYLQNRDLGLACDEALCEASAGVGPAITTGAVTTAVAFFAAGLTEFTGIAELGIIAGGGILCCCVAQLFVLPACIYLVDRHDRGRRVPAALPCHPGVHWLCRSPKVVLAGAMGCCVAAGVGLNQLWFDHNLLNMQPEGLESVAWEHKLLEQSDQSMWYALSIADTREELLAKKAEFQKLGAVARVEEIVSMLPTEHEVKQPIIERIHARLSALPERPPLIAVDQPEELGRVLGRLQMMLSMSGQFPRAAGQFEQARDALRRLPVTECYTRLSAFQQQMAGDLLSRLHVLGNMANPESPKLTDLPPSLVNRFVGQHGKHLLKIYGRGNIWDMEALKRFVHDVRTVDPAATGNPVQAYEASLEMKRSYEHSAYYALVVIVVVLLVDFRSIGTSLLASIPLALGMLMGFGALGLLGIPLNPANMLALPLILGVGIDYGVHVVHDYLEQEGPYRMSPAIATAVTIDALTTIVGFGSLMIASHRGLQSLGRVLVICVTCTLLCSLTVLPAMLAWVTRNRRKADAEDPQEAAAEPRTAAAGLQRRFDYPHAAPAGPHVRPAARPAGTRPSTPGVREL